MSNTLRIKRRTTGASGAPTVLANAELAFNEVNNTLYYGKGDNGAGVATSVIAIGGDGTFATKNYVDTAVAAATPSGVAYLDQSNTFGAGYTNTFNGTVNLEGAFQIDGSAVNTSAAELNLLDSAVANTVVNGKAVIYGASGEITASSLASVGAISAVGSLSAAGSAFLVDENGAIDADSISVTGNVSTTGSGTFGTLAVAVDQFTVDNSGNVYAAGDVEASGSGSFGGDLTVTGNLTINGTTTTINSTTLSVDDKNIVLGDITTPTDVTADGGGITLKGATDKTFNWVDATDAWTSSEHMNLLTGKAYYIAGTSVLSATALGAGVISSSLTSVGTIGTGTWQGTAVAVAYGGTGATTASGARTNLGLGSSDAVTFNGLTLTGPLTMSGIGGTITAQGASFSASVTVNANLTVNNGGFSINPGGVMQPDNFTLTSAGVITKGTWQGTAVAVAYGGTGATTAAGARTNLGLAIGTDVQAYDAELAAIAGLTSAADRLPYFTGAGTAALATFTSFGRSLVDDADAATARTTLGLVIGTNVQAYDAELAALAGLTSAADALPYFTGSGTASTTTLTTFARTLLDDTDASTMRTTLGLVIGTNVQAYDATLAALAGVTTAADKLIYATGVDTFATTDLTSFARTLLDDTSASTARTTLSAAGLADANAFTGANTFTNTTGQTFRPAATNDGIIVKGRAGGTNSYAATLDTATLSANRTLTLPDESGTLLTDTSICTAISNCVIDGGSF